MPPPDPKFYHPCNWWEWENWISIKISASSNSTFKLKFWILDQNSFKSPSCADIYVDVKKCSIDPWCSPFEIDDVQNNADCQKECQNTNRECKSWIQYYKNDENVGKNDFHLAGNSNPNSYTYQDHF